MIKELEKRLAQIDLEATREKVQDFLDETEGLDDEDMDDEVRHFFSLLGWFGEMSDLSKSVFVSDRDNKDGFHAVVDWVEEMANEELGRGSLVAMLTQDIVPTELTRAGVVLRYQEAVERLNLPQFPALANSL